MLSCACRGWSVWNFPPGGSRRPPGDQINHRWSSVALVLLPPLSPAAPRCTSIPDRTGLAGRGEEARITLCIWKCGTFKASSLIGRKVGVDSWWTLAVVSEQPSHFYFYQAFCILQLLFVGKASTLPGYMVWLHLLSVYRLFLPLYVNVSHFTSPFRYASILLEFPKVHHWPLRWNSILEPICEKKKLL